MHDDVHVCPDVQVAFLQRALQRDSERREGWAVFGERREGVCIAGLLIFVCVWPGGLGQWCCWDATCHWDIGVDVEFKKVVEVVGEGGDGAGYCFGDAIAEGERSSGFVAGVEGDILEFALAVSDLFAIAVSYVVAVCVS